ncbi:MAG: exodeoxyribonuclease VII small subunit [Nitrospinota bacterium]
MAEKKFEADLKQLEKIIEELENGDLDLDKSLKKFEEGVRLSRLCSKKLDDAEKRIEVLTKSPEGKVKAIPFSSKPDDSPSS